MAAPLDPQADALAAPDAAAWARLGFDAPTELRGGHQSRVFRAARGDERLVVKLTDPRLVDGHHFATRVELVARLAASDPAVVGPVLVGGALVTKLASWMAVAYPEVEGTALDVSRPEDVERMGRALATLHRSLRGRPSYELPLVAALRAGPAPPPAPDPSGLQLLHGDWSVGNLRLTDDCVRVFDFDDCGYGPVTFDVGNALYMVLFDATLDDDFGHFERFRTGFVAAYQDESGTSAGDGELERVIEARRAALGRWLDDLSTAPIGIRASSPRWRRRLRSFVDGR